MPNDYKILIWCRGFNAEKTISRAVESILNQTYENWVLILVDNGSTDRTTDIVRDYGEKDSRIKTFFNEENNVYVKGSSLRRNVIYNKKYDFICILDADDEYKPDFLEKSIDFLVKNNLDLVICGFDFIDSRNNRLIEEKKLPNDLIVKGAAFDEHFISYQMFLRTRWGILFSKKVIMEAYKEQAWSAYGGDTIFVLNNLKHCDSFGILSDTLYKYYIKQSTNTSNVFNPKRIEASAVLHNAYKDFLYSKCDYISKRNKDLIDALYLENVRDALILILNAKLQLQEKLKYILTLLQDRITAAAFISGTNEFYPEELKQSFINDCLTILKELRVNSGNNLLGSISSELEFLRETRLPESSVLMNAQCDDIDLYFEFKDIIEPVLHNDFITALDAVIEAVDNEGIKSNYAEKIYTLALTLAAITEKEPEFIWFKKLLISAILDSGNIEKATLELADWDILLPDDEDFKELRMRVEGSL